MYRSKQHQDGAKQHSNLSTSKKRHGVRKNKLSIVSAAVFAVALSGCNATMQHTCRQDASYHGLAETRMPIPMERQVDRGLTVPLGRQASVNIDIKCILDYVQGDAEIIENQPLIDDIRYPWIRFNVDF